MYFIHKKLEPLPTPKLVTQLIHNEWRRTFGSSIAPSHKLFLGFMQKKITTHGIESTAPLSTRVICTSMGLGFRISGEYGPSMIIDAQFDNRSGVDLNTLYYTPWIRVREWIKKVKRKQTCS